MPPDKWDIFSLEYARRVKSCIVLVRTQVQEMSRVGVCVRTDHTEGMLTLRRPGEKHERVFWRLIDENSERHSRLFGSASVMGVASIYMAGGLHQFIAPGVEPVNMLMGGPRPEGAMYLCSAYPYSAGEYFFLHVVPLKIVRQTHERIWALPPAGARELIKLLPFAAPAVDITGRLVGLYEGLSNEDETMTFLGEAPIFAAIAEMEFQVGLDGEAE